MDPPRKAFHTETKRDFERTSGRADSEVWMGNYKLSEKFHKESVEVRTPLSGGNKDK